MNRQEQHYKRTEERIRLYSLIMRYNLNALLITFVGTVGVWTSDNQEKQGTFIILGTFVILILSILFVVLYYRIKNNINRY